MPQYLYGFGAAVAWPAPTAFPERTCEYCGRTGEGFQCEGCGAPLRRRLVKPLDRRRTPDVPMEDPDRETADEAWLDVTAMSDGERRWVKGRSDGGMAPRRRR